MQKMLFFQKHLKYYSYCDIIKCKELYRKGFFACICKEIHGKSANTDYPKKFNGMRF
jgi:hypothetical protein